jgi:hypothetical protein
MIKKYDDFFESNMKGKDLTKFVRFGGLDLKNQKGFGSDSYHAPPARRGFYSMPYVAQEFFLIGSMNKYQPGTMPKDVKYDETLPEDEMQTIWDQHEKRRKKALSSMRKVFIKKTGHIWHHLIDETPNNEVIARHNSWIKTTMDAWRKAFTKMSLTQRYGEDDWAKKSVNQSKLFGWYSKDHCEVFFDEKV